MLDGEDPRVKPEDDVVVKPEDDDEESEEDEIVKPEEDGTKTCGTKVPDSQLIPYFEDADLRVLKDAN